MSPCRLPLSFRIFISLSSHSEKQRPIVSLSHSQSRSASGPLSLSLSFDLEKYRGVVECREPVPLFLSACATSKSALLACLLGVSRFSASSFAIYKLSRSTLFSAPARETAGRKIFHHKECCYKRILRGGEL